MQRFFLAGLPAFVLLLSLGCSKNAPPGGSPQSASPTTASAGADTAAAAAAEQGSAEQTSETAETTSGQSKKADSTDQPTASANRNARTSLEGKWILALNQGIVEIYTYLIEFTKSGDGSYSAKLLAKSEEMVDAKLNEFQVQDGLVSFVLEMENGAAIDFAGKLVDGNILGDFHLGEFTYRPVRLVTTSETDLKKYKEPVEISQKEAFFAVVTAEKKFAGLRSFGRENRHIPLAMLAFQEAFAQIGPEGISDADVETFVGEIVAGSSVWGSRSRRMACLNIASRLAAMQRLPGISLKYLNEVERDMSDAEADAWKSSLRLTKGTVNLLSPDQAQQQQGAELLELLHHDEPFSSGVTLALAEFAEKKGQTDRAIELYGELSVLPNLESRLQRQLDSGQALPSERVARLWKEQHGSSKGLDEFLAKVYRERIATFADERREARSQAGPNRVVLCELFTGAQCPPCVAADVATGGLEKTYPSSDVIVLRYHIHVPGPDPLANEHTEARQVFYQPRGTPTVYLNGRMVEFNVGGFLESAQDVYRELRKAVDPLLEQPSEVRIKASAALDNGKLLVTASAEGLPKDSEKVRLRIVLVEDDVTFEAGNGIRQHEMIARWMFGKSDGVAPKDGTIQFDETIELNDIKQDLSKYLTKYEQAMLRRFPAKPLDLTHLHLVALVQDDATQDVLQATLVPVTGDSSTTGAPASDAKPSSQPEPASRP